MVVKFVIMVAVERRARFVISEHDTVDVWNMHITVVRVVLSLEWWFVGRTVPLGIRSHSGMDRYYVDECYVTE